MTLHEMIKDLPKECDKGAKKDSKGNTMYWNGYKLHLDTVDGGIPVSALVTSASTHDSQVAIPPSNINRQKDHQDYFFTIPKKCSDNKKIYKNLSRDLHKRILSIICIIQKNFVLIC